ncbi:unnamed protein product [Polarella glacialis]|uniref:EamA domain-containing protein n=1 Tax=Polarella glacialis TaxID=89957 RepID=A0A813HL40_POLGL|nr:unnamed protein product [Polarella glacialis]CAE8639280.1 unnamed protein product [Polarella glacialis]
MGVVDGFVAAAVAPGVMTVGFFIWGNVWTGSGLMLNAFKGILASMIFLAVFFLTAAIAGQPCFPPMSWNDLFFLWLSSLLGIVLGDTFWLLALARIGARRVILVDSIKPFLATTGAAILLNEVPSWEVLVGMAVTVAGVLLVGLELPPESSELSASDKSEKQKGKLDSGTGSNSNHNNHSSNNNSNNISRTFLGHWCFWHCMGLSGQHMLPNNNSNNNNHNSKNTQGQTLGVAADCREDFELDLVPSERAPSDSDNVGKIEHNSGERKAEIVEAVQVAAEDGSSSKAKISASSLAVGYAFSVCNCFFDVIGWLLVKQHGRGSTTWHINLIRFGTAGIEIAIFLGAVVFTSRVMGRTPPDWCLIPKGLGRRGWAVLCLGVVFVTFVTPALTQYAIFEIEMAPYVTLTSTGPIWALPIGWVLKRERVSRRACCGSLLAVLGVVPLALAQANNE